MTKRAEQIAAARLFTETWRPLLAEAGGLQGNYACSLTCAEAETVADLYRAFGDAEAADAIIAGHAVADDPGDAHYQPKAEP